LIQGALSKQKALYYIRIPLSFISIALDTSWLMVAPALVWAITTIYVPILGPGLSGFRAWTAALVILLFILLSLVTHTLAHVLMARVLRCDIPAMIPIHLLGDIAQIWPAARSAGAEALVSIGGLLAQGFLATLAFVFWNAQLNQFLNVISFFLMFFNFGLLILNLTPTFPFDGGRLMRSVLWQLGY
jgi:Zn-dependent protease